MNELAETCLLALGANLPQPEGDPTLNLKRALRELSCAGLEIRSVSRFFATPCFPVGAGPDYVNAAVEIDTDLSPHELLERLHAIETMLERNRDTRWGMRTLDLDLIAFGQLVLPDLETYLAWSSMPLDQQIERTPDQLILPHPRLSDRAFVLVPLADIAPDWVHPVTGKTVMQMLDALPAEDRGAVRPI